VPSQITSDFTAFSFRRCELLHLWMSSIQSITVSLADWSGHLECASICWAGSRRQIRDKI